MPTFNVGQQHDTSEPQILVEVTPNAPLPVGTHRFQLVVVDNEGLESLAAIAEVLVRDLGRPTAKIEVRPKVVEQGKNFLLFGGDSVDVPPGVIKSWKWTRLD